jgi:protein O-GlcNAc transferase
MTDLQRAQSLLEQGRYAESAARCERLLRSKPLDADALQLLGLARIGMGRVPDGIICLQNAAAANPNKPGLLVLLGDALMRCGEATRAAAVFARAIERSGPTAQLLYNLALARQKAGDSAGAIDGYRQCLALDPRVVEAHNNLGTLLDLEGRYGEAIECFNEALKHRPGYVRALTNLGKVQRQAGSVAEAVVTLEQALAASPEHAPALANLAAALVDLDRPDEALEAGRRAIGVDPRLAQAHFHLGRALFARREYDIAIVSLRKAIELQPDLTDARVQLARALLQEGELSEAIGHLERAAAAKDPSAETHVLLGIALTRAERLEDAIASFDRAIAVDAGCLRAYKIRGWAQEALDRYPQAAASCEQALVLSPDNPEIMSTLFNCYMRMCDWRRAGAQLEHIRAVAGGIEGANPFVMLGAADEPAEHLRAARGWGERIMRERAPLPGARRYHHGRIRLAYLSRDFFNHATSILAAELFELHDRAAFEVYGVSYGPDDGSPIRSRIAAACHEFLEVRTSSDRDIARALLEREIDILVDLKGYTAWARTELLAYRPAPIQVNYLGYPGTMGVELVDYLIADSWLIPEAERSAYSESIARLPDCYQVNDRRRAIAPIHPQRAEVGLPQDAFVFCCLNNNWKITEPVFDVWMRLLHAIPGSVLWLLAGNTWSDERLREEARARGIAPERLIFCERTAHAEHLARHRLADLFLDTLPVNAHTTASDALWVGLPVVTCSGRSFAARVAGSLLRAAGVAELVTGSLEEYEQKALVLARDPGRLHTIRERLVRERDTAPLFDTPAFCTHLEAAYRRMWEIYESGAAPHDFSIER